ncbi:MAG: T9SS type A sorting domain-containing protein [Saprospiraceae bacterium]|nr:T9SS type A sorting domain-containing protein [Saprospiraceae bacterium]
MKLENFTLNTFARFGMVIRMSILPALLVVAQFSVSAQCPLACNNLVQVSMDDDCVVEVTPAMMLEGVLPAGCSYAQYSVRILGANGQPLSPANIVNRSHLDQTLTTEVWLGNNRCWGKILVQDKKDPEIECPRDVTVACYSTAAIVLPDAFDNCDQNVPVTISSNTLIKYSCSGTLSAVRTLIYEATDDSGNEATPCIRNIYYSRVTLPSVLFQFPLNRDDVQSPALNCDNVPVWDVIKENGTPGRDNYPQPSESGVPTIGGVPILPNNTLCEINVTFTDQRVDICENSFKILRHWRALDWCTGTLEQSYQIIKILDKRPPAVTILPTIPPDMTITNCLGTVSSLVEVDPYTCRGTWDVERPTELVPERECNDWTYTVAFLLNNGTEIPPLSGAYVTVSPDGITRVIGNSANGYQIIGLPQGCAWIRYIVTDACGNSATVLTEIFVQDKVPPTPVCDRTTVVTLSNQNNGWARVFAETFDDGSHDNCSNVTFRVRRMTTPQRCNMQGGPNTHNFGPFVDVCCADVGRELMVELEVKDASNNVNTCMVFVEVNDKINPKIVCTASKTIECNVPLEFDAPTATDNCGTPTITILSTTGTISNCGTGSRTRTWEARDAGQRTDVCSQTITVVNNTPYTGPRPQDWPTSPITKTGCLNVDTDPSSTGVPFINATVGCSQVAYTKEDQVFQFVEGVCYKILRRWTVIDWCKFHPNTRPNGSFYPTGPTSENTWTFTQIIKVNNADNPVIAKRTDVTACGTGETCDLRFELTNTATDICTPSAQLKWKWEVAPFDGPNYTIFGNTNDATRNYPIGTHRIRWTVEDLCGNQDVVTHLFTVEDCKKPTPYCISDITTVVMPSSGTVEIWAIDYDLGATDNCPGELYFTFNCEKPNKGQVELGNNHYFKGNGILATEAEYLAGNAQYWLHDSRTSGILFDCDDVGVVDLNVCVTDASGNQDYCSVVLQVQANPPACQNFSRIAGNVSNENNEMVPETFVIIENMNTNETKAFKTDENGLFTFNSMPESNSYKLVSEKNQDYSNGVSTLDLVLVQRHILNIATLPSPYKVIAADINNDKKINTIDLVELRKLILGVYTELPANKSWRFVDKTFVFADNTHPWPFNEYIMVNDYNGNAFDKNFMAVKIGDVNNDAKVNFTSKDTDTRNKKALKLIAQDADYKANEKVFVDITADNYSEIFGSQFTLEFDHAKLQFANIHSGEITIDASNYNAAQTYNGLIAMSWNHTDTKSYNKNEVLFTIEFTATTNGTISRTLSINSDITKAESYTQNLDVMNVEMEFRTNTVSSNVTFDLYQNNPNPFAENTVISFNLVKAAPATLKLYDVTGKVIKQINNQYPAGYNEIIIKSEDNLTEGVIFYELESEGYKATKKMIYLSK